MGKSFAASLAILDFYLSRGEVVVVADGEEAVDEVEHRPGIVLLLLIEGEIVVGDG